MREGYYWANHKNDKTPEIVWVGTIYKGGPFAREVVLVLGNEEEWPISEWTFGPPVSPGKAGAGSESSQDVD